MNKQEILQQADITTINDNGTPVAVYDKHGNKLSFQFFDFAPFKEVDTDAVTVNGETQYGILSPTYSSIDVEFSIPKDDDPQQAPQTQPGDLDRLRAFSKAMIRVAFEGGDLSGADIQEMALEHGLLDKTTYDPAKHGSCDHGSEPGDTWYTHSSVITG